VLDGLATLRATGDGAQRQRDAFAERKLHGDVIDSLVLR
jgi:hypothetical protein